MIMMAASVLTILFVFLGTATVNKVFTYLGIATAVIGMAVYLIFGRCPHCGKYLGWNSSSKCCPHCGEKIED